MEAALPADAAIAVRRARLGDVPEIKGLIDFYAAQNRMLFRAQAELYETIREYHVAVYEEAGGAARVVGAGGLHVTWEDLAEIRGLAVAPAAAGRGVGTKLVRACLAESVELGLRQVYTLTLVPEFFERLGLRACRARLVAHQGVVRVLQVPEVRQLRRDRDDPPGGAVASQTHCWHLPAATLRSSRHPHRAPGR